MDWFTFLIILAQVVIGSITFMIISFPIAGGLQLIARALRRPRTDHTIYSGSDND